MPSRNGIFYQLEESPWIAREQGMTFYFSSSTHYNRFVREVDKRMRNMTATMGERIGCPVNMRPAACIQLYRQVETRGFLVKYMHNGEEVTATCLEQLELGGLLPRPRGFKKRSEATMLP